MRFPSHFCLISAEGEAGSVFWDQNARNAFGPLNSGLGNLSLNLSVNLYKKLIGCFLDRLIFDPKNRQAVCKTGFMTGQVAEPSLGSWISSNHDGIKIMNSSAGNETLRTI